MSLAAPPAPELELFLSFPIVRKSVDTTNPYAVIVEGYCTGSEVDADNEIVDPDYARGALDKWFGTGGNIRQQHLGTYLPAGKAVSMDHRPQGTWLVGRILEPTAVKLVMEGVYNDWSLGIGKPVQRVWDPKYRANRIVGGPMVEVSVVDRGSYPNSKFSIADVQKRLKLAHDPERIAYLDRLTRAGDPWMAQDAREQLARLGAAWR